MVKLFGSIILILNFFTTLSYCSNPLENIHDEQYESCSNVIKQVLNFRKAECRDIRTVLRLRTFVCPDALLISVKGKVIQSFYSAFGQVDFEEKSLVAEGIEIVENWSSSSIAKNPGFLKSELKIEMEEVSSRVKVYDLLAEEPKLIGGWSWKTDYQAQGGYGSLYRIEAINNRELPPSPKEIRLLKVVVATDEQDQPTQKFKEAFAGKIYGYSKF